MIEACNSDVKLTLFYFSVMFSVMGFIAPNVLYCTSSDWITSLKHTTPFCTISGKNHAFFACIQMFLVLRFKSMIINLVIKFAIVTIL